MKTLSCLVVASLLLAVGFSQQANTPPAHKQEDKKTPVIGDKERADYLLAQRDWMEKQSQYAVSFAKEPVVQVFDKITVGLQTMCQAGGSQFNPGTAQCQVPTPVSAEAAKTPAKK